MKIYHTEQKHWVGNGFYVSNLLPGYEKHMNHDGLPFLMLDYQSPKYFAPTYQKLGVGTHPHKGFETLTIVYSGGVEHRDSKGNGGIIQAGEAQWMTAGRGIAHSEFYDADFLREGGEAEFVQIWIKLPPKDELTEPRYQSITQADVMEGEENGIHIRLFAGSYKGLSSATKTFSPIIIADLIWRSSTSERLDLPKGYKSYLLIRKGSVEIKEQAISPGSLIEIEETDTPLTVHGESGAEILLLSGEPWNDTIYHYGPFVLHDQKELFKTLGNGV